MKTTIVTAFFWSAIRSPHIQERLDAERRRAGWTLAVTLAPFFDANDLPRPTQSLWSWTPHSRLLSALWPHTVHPE